MPQREYSHCGSYLHGCSCIFALWYYHVECILIFCL